MNGHGKAVTPSDSQQLSLATNHLYVGTVLPVSAVQVKVTGTTATNLVALS